jgi:hypothetical protein
MTERKYNHTFGDLIDRLSILQLKEVFIPEHKQEYSEEMKLILEDLQTILDCEETSFVNANTIRHIIVLAQMNLHIWSNESEVRKNGGEGNLYLTHGLNGIRNTAKNKIQELVGGRKDYKIDCIAAEFKDWLPSGYEEAKKDI